MSTFSATPHERVATPVTPRHSPPPSLHSASSVRSYTPVHSLSLHEYRKQRSSPRTPEPPEGRRLKRKAAATRLNASEREPLLHQPNPPRLPPTPPSTSHSEPTRREPDSSFNSLRVSSFRSLPALQQRPSLGLRDIARLNASSADLPPVNPSHAPALPRDFGLGSRKRLPRPKDVEIRRPFATSPIPTEPSSLDLLSTAGLASTSTFTLSNFQFPEPPHPRLATQSPTPLNLWPRDSHPAPTPSLLDTPPATPALLHFRGTSFDVVNPHNSLYLSNLETPADQDEPNDYFHRTSLDQLLPADMPPGSVTDDGVAKQMPRPLFNDFRSAHASIAKTNPQPSQQAERPVHDHADAILSSATPAAHLSAKPDRRASIIDRARTVFRRKESKPMQVDEGLKGLAYSSTSVAYHTPTTDASGSSATIAPGQARADATRPSGDTWETLSDSAGPQYDQASVYPDTEFDSNSLYFGPINNRLSAPFGVKNQITDYSGEILYKFEDTPRHSVYTNLSRHPSVESRGACTLSKNIDNTLGNIYDQYGGQDTFDATKSTNQLLTDDEDDDDDTIRVPSLRSMVPSSPHVDRVSGLSKFDFGLDEVRSSGDPESPVTSPVTPQDGVFPRALAMMRPLPGKPPNSPPPLASGELGEAHRVYTHVSDDFSNRASSYGDTRKLLGISGNTDAMNRMSAITEASRLSQGDKLPQSPLQELMERCDSQRGTPELEKYRDHTQNDLPSSETNASMESDVSVGGMTFQMPEKENAAPIQPEPSLRRQATVSNAERKSTGSDIPAIWMRSVSPGPRNESPATLATEGSDGDWETLAQTTTAGDRTRRNSTEPALPTPDSSSLKRTNTNPWRRNKLAEVETSSPVMTSPSDMIDIPRFPRDSQLSFLRQSRAARDVRRSTVSTSNSANSRPFELSATQVKNLLAFGPNDEIVEEHEMSPLAHKTVSHGLGPSSCVANGSSRVNSFDKFTLVGPEANLTGTPMGTGMRFAGSSTVGSTPSTNNRAYQEILTSSPPGMSTPARQSLLGRSNNTARCSPSGSLMANTGQNNPFQTPSSYRPSPLARGSIVSSSSSRAPPLSYGKEIEDLRAASSSRAERYRKMKSTSVGSSMNSTPRVNGMPMSRASVAGMTSPFPLTLRCQDSTTFSCNPSEPGTVVRPGSGRTAEPLHRHSPHLLQLPRPCSSDMTDKVKKKERLSWIIFAMCAWFPPTAMLLFLGAFDGLMFQMSGREILHVSQFQKKSAMVAFVAEVIVLVLILALWLGHVF
ncbi:notch2 protein [Diplodia corticola]|uniref:Notch2 protein n=1 Tax=Diplodia corticola TaxID=236234 RepID=A0A1J9S647_9PEZI|nr:notch2 protein [Diplodia corticola]OJD35428.1 notch2 protein [Diplodia corticola]